MNPTSKRVLLSTVLTLTGMCIAPPTLAQSSLPAPGMAIQFRTDGNGLLPENTLETNAVGIGYDTTPGDGLGGAFADANTIETAASVFNRLRTDRTILAGSSFQVAVRGHAVNHLESGQPVTVYASIFPYNPAVPGGAVPIDFANPVIRNVPILFADSGTDQLANNIYFSDVVTLSASILADTDYVIAFTGDDSSGTPEDAVSAVVYRRVFSQIVETDPGLDPDDLYPEAVENTIFQSTYYTNTNSGDTGGSAFQFTGVAANPITYQFWSANASAPEPASVVLLLSSMASLAFIRRRPGAK